MSFDYEGAIREGEAAISEEVRALLADRDSALKDVSDYPVLAKRVRVFLNGEDVTKRCRAFSIPGGVVKLYGEREDGGRIIEVSCDCGRTTNPELKAAARRDVRCRVCNRDFEFGLDIDLHYGKVEVVPK